MRYLMKSLLAKALLCFVFTSSVLIDMQKSQKATMQNSLSHCRPAILI